MFFICQAEKQIQASLSPRIMVHVVQNMTVLWEKNSPSQGVVFKPHGKKSLSELTERQSPNLTTKNKKVEDWGAGEWRDVFVFFPQFFFPTKRGYFWSLLGTRSDISSPTAKDLSRRLKSTMFNQGGFSFFGFLKLVGVEDLILAMGSWPSPEKPTKPWDLSWEELLNL